MSTRRLVGPGLLAGLGLLLALPAGTATAQQVTRYVRFHDGTHSAYGILAGQQIRELSGAPWSDARPAGRTVRTADVRLLAPVEPGKIIAVGLNYKSHIGERPAAAYPGLFAKYPSSVIGPGDSIVRPPDAGNLHYEGEMVIVIGRRAKNVPREQAADYVFGVTAGNDVSERDWQRNDLQWLRAKASDAFAPIGPMIVRGLDYNDLHLVTRVNGEVRQDSRTSLLIFDVADVVSYVSRYVTLDPGDVIFTGTPGTTRAMENGDVVEIELEGVGVLRNTVVAAPAVP